MNPYELPAEIQISERTLRLWGTPKFADAFLCEMMEHENDLPLPDMCQSGGSPSSDDNAEIEDLKIQSEKGGIARGNFFVSFIEESPTGCRDRTWRDRIHGRIDFRLNLSDGTVTFEPPTLERQYEPEEF